MANELVCLNELCLEDDGTAELILQLLANDIQAVLQSKDHKDASEEPDDTDVALAAHKKDIEDNLRVRADRRMARSTMLAAVRDGPLLLESTAEENLAVGDRDLAHRLAGVNHRPTALEQTVPGQDLDEESLRRAVVLYGQNSDSTRTGEQSSRYMNTSGTI